MKKITKISAVTSFFLGAFFVLANDSEITGNVVAVAQSSNVGIAQTVGIVMIIASVGLFIISLEDSVKKERIQTKESKELTSDYVNSQYANKEKEYKPSEDKK